MFLSGVVICGPGKIRQQNQDNYFLNGSIRDNPNDMLVHRMQTRAYDQGLFAVADGMGGEQHGEIASWIAVRGMDSIRCDAGYTEVTAYLQQKNSEICSFIESKGGRRCGTTCVCLCIRGGEADIVNIGDSRAYLLREEKLYQISKDHTVGRQMLEAGAITKEELRTHPERHRLTQHLGIFPDEMLIEPYSAVGKTQPNDLYLLCSDGLYDLVENRRIRELLMSEDGISEIAAALYAEAMGLGGKDNITILLVRVEAAEVDALDETI